MSDRRYTNPRTGEVFEDVDARSFHEVLKELGEGSTNSELSANLYELIQRVQDTGKSGSIVFTLHVGFDGQGRISMKDAVKLKLPEFNRPDTAFFLDKHGNPSRRDPNQPVIPGVTQISNHHREAN